MLNKARLLSTVADARVGLSQLADNQFEKIRRAIGNARVVLIGEETHGTQEFYALRAEITKALIEREDFSLVLCESDFPSFYKLHQFVGGTQSATQMLSNSPSDIYSASKTASEWVPSMETSEPSSHPAAIPTKAAAEKSNMSTEEVMEVLKDRFPVWMWRNEVVRDFVQWLQTENLRREITTTAQYFSTLPVALFGLDIYSIFTSIDQVMSYLDVADPQMAERARKRYGVLQKFRPDEIEYCRAVLHGKIQPQNNKIKLMLDDLNGKTTEYKRLFGDGDEYFNAHENARIVLAAEEYYRQSYFGGSLTWNIRDHVMVDMIMNALDFHDEKLAALHRDNVESRKTEEGHRAPPQRARAVVWAHNSHIGDAEATEQYERCGQVNVGHLVRQVLGKEDCFLIGLSTNSGTVRAARRWNGRDHVLELNPALQGSTGDVVHQASKVAPEMSEFGLFFRRNSVDELTPAALTPAEEAARAEMEPRRLERFVGVQYAKQSERQSHYSMCSLSNQFDLLIHLDETSALRPLPELTEVTEPHVPPPPSASLRPGTVDSTKWDKFCVDHDDEDEEREPAK